jgi:hypothetical protein
MLQIWQFAVNYEASFGSSQQNSTDLLKNLIFTLTHRRNVCNGIKSVLGVKIWIRLVPDLFGQIQIQNLERAHWQLVVRLFSLAVKLKVEI